MHDAFAWDCVIGPGPDGDTEARARAKEARLLRRHMDRGRRHKAGASGRGRQIHRNKHVQWMDGGFFLVTHSEFNGAMGKGAEKSYMGYDSNDKMYTYDPFNTL